MRELVCVNLEQPIMKTQAFIELLDLNLITKIGTYGFKDAKPGVHLLNLILEIDAKQVLISDDKMNHVFDYDPLLKEIDRLAGLGQYETQEYLMTLIARACVTYPEIKTIEMSLSKAPARNGNGSLGVRLILNEAATIELRSIAKTY